MSLPVVLACQITAGSVSLAQPLSRPERSRAEPGGAPPRMRASGRNGKLRCAGHGADAVLVVLATAAFAPKGPGRWEHWGRAAQPPPTPVTRAGGRPGR